MSLDHLRDWITDLEAEQLASLHRELRKLEVKKENLEARVRRIAFDAERRKADGVIANFDRLRWSAATRSVLDLVEANSTNKEK